MHAKLGGTFQVQSPVVNEAAFLCRDLVCFQRTAVNALLRFAQADEARADKKSKDFSQTVFLDAIEIQVARLVVDRPHEVPRRTGQRGGEREHFRLGLREREHELPKNVARERPRAIENRPVEVLVKRDLSPFERGNHHGVTILEFFLADAEVIEGSQPLLMIPGICKKNAADVPEDGLNVRQEWILSVCASSANNH